MSHYILVDKAGYISGYSFSDSTPGDGWIKTSDSNAPTVMQKNTRCRLVDNVIEQTNVPFFPPHPWLFWKDGSWVDSRTIETQWALVRDERNQLLEQSDWTQLPDVLLNDKAAWVSYRQNLRDITNQPDPFNIIWPTPPQ